MEWFPIILAGAPVVASVSLWMVRLEGRQTAHELKDETVHIYMKDSLEDLKISVRSMNEKLDRLIEKRHNG